MEKIGLRTLRNDLTRVMERVKGGESFLITDRGKVIATLLVQPDYSQSRHAHPDNVTCADAGPLGHPAWFGR